MLSMQGDQATVNPKANHSWIFIGTTDAEDETPTLWPPDVKNWFLGKDPDAGKDWGQEEKGMAENEMVGWHHWLKGHEFEQAPRVGDGQGSPTCCILWGCKELDMTEQLNWTDWVSVLRALYFFSFKINPIHLHATVSVCMFYSWSSAPEIRTQVPISGISRESGLKFALGLITTREGMQCHSSANNWINVLLSKALLFRSRPIFPIASPSH